LSALAASLTPVLVDDSVGQSVQARCQRKEETRSGQPIAEERRGGALRECRE
jgi:hypothetical protein